jgi:hypothetical protein
MRGVIHALMLMAAFGLLTSRPLVEAQKPRAERPVYTLGERWIRSDGVYDLIRVEDGRYIFAAGVDRQIHLTQDLMVAKVQKGGWVMEFTPPPKLTWPLEVGKWGTNSGLWRTPRYPQGSRSGSPGTSRPTRRCGSSPARSKPSASLSPSRLLASLPRGEAPLSPK